MKAFMVDVARCNGCHNCQFACKDEHCDNEWMPYARMQPETGQFWMRVDERVRGNVPVVRLSYTPVFCAHCGQAPCMEAAEGGAVYRREDGLVLIDPDKAAGQRAIAEACPVGAVYWNEELGLPQKCTGCAHLLDDGWSEPRCVDACPTGALRFGELEGFAAELAQAAPLPGAEGLSPLSYYLNLPKRFVAGCMVDRAANEVIIGAAVTLAAPGGEAVASTVTDEFGDWLFDQAEPGEYVVRIEADGYEPAELAADLRDRDVSLGDYFATPA